ncbi:MAG: LamG-like jellyroll fold domain-containing protein [Planctomycetaceae bacterium]
MNQGSRTSSGADAGSKFQEIFRRAFGKRRQRRYRKGLEGTESLETRVLLYATRIINEGPEIWNMADSSLRHIGPVPLNYETFIDRGGLRSEYHPDGSNSFDTDTIRFEMTEDGGPLARVSVNVYPSRGPSFDLMIPTRKSGADGWSTVDLNRLISAELSGPGSNTRLAVVTDDQLYASLDGLPKGEYTLRLKITNDLRSVWTFQDFRSLSYNYTVTVDNRVPGYPNTRPWFTETRPAETSNNSITLGTIGVHNSTTVVNGYLNSNSLPALVTDHDAYEFQLPSRGITGSQVRVSYLPATGRAGKIRDLIQATLTTQFGQVTVRPELPKDAAGEREFLFDLKGYSAQTPFRLELKSLPSVGPGGYSVELTHPLPEVSLGPVVSLSEGFGYLSTIEGLEKAFDASGQLFSSQLGRPLNLSATNRAAIESWFYPKSSDGASTIWEFRNQQGQVTWQLKQVNGRGLHVHVLRGRGASAKYFDAGKTGILNTEAWNHLAMTFDGRQLRLFVNGVSVLTIPENSGNAGVQSVLGDINTVSFGGGLIDEVRVWNVARTQSEIQQGLLSAFSGTEPGLQAYWSFDKLTGRDIADLSPNHNSLHLPSTQRVENAVPQIGYVDVLLDQKVSDPKGLVVTYELSGTAKATVDFIPSRFRTVTTDPNTEREGIIIPFGEKSARIYFMAKQDTLAEAAESINVTLKPFSFEGIQSGQDYRIGVHNSKSLEIIDSGAYKVGIAVTDASGRTITANNPLHLDPVTKLGKFYFRLTSQPIAAVEPIIIQMDANSTLSPSSTRGGTFGVEFKTEDWDKPIEFTIRSFLTSGTEGSFEFSSELRDRQGRVRTDRYLTTPVRFSTTLNPPPREARPTEGSAADAISTTPTVNLKHLRDVREDASKPGAFSVELSAPAPEGGLVVHYAVSTSSHATAGIDYRRLPGFVFVPEGLRQTEIPVYAIDDQVYEGTSEDLVITLQSNSRYHIGTAGNPTVLIKEDDHADIYVVNTSILDVDAPKSPARPLHLIEGAATEQYTTTFNVLPSVGKTGSYEVPAWSYTGGLASKVSSSDGDTIPFDLLTTGDPTAKLTLTLTPTTALGTRTLPTVRTGGDSEHNINLDRLLRSALRLTGGGSSAAGHVVGDSRIEWSLAGLAAGRYLVDLSLPVISQILATNTDSTSVLTYEYRLEFVSSPTAPFVVLTTRTETELSSSYSTLVTNEPLTSQTAQLEPNNDTIASAPDLGVVTENAEVLKQTVSSSVDKDHFRFTLDSTLGRPDTLIARFSHTSQSDLRLQLLSTAGHVIRTSDEQSNNEYMDLRDLADGEYVALVTASPRGAARFVEEPYALKLTRLQLGVEPGPNDDMLTAPHLGAVHDGDRFAHFSLNTVTDQDYFHFTLDTASGRPDSVSLLSIAADGVLGMSLHSLPDDREVSKLSGNQTKLSLAGLPDGLYGIRIFRFAPGTMNRYDLGFGTITPLAGERNLNQVAVRLHSRPTANVSITFHSDDLTEGTVTNVPFIFTPDNWDQPQFVTVTPLADQDSGTNKNTTYTVTGSASSSDPNYQHRMIRFAVTNVDNGEFVAPTVPSQLENGAPAEGNLPVVSIQKLKRGAVPEGHTDDAFAIKIDRPLATDLTVGVDFRRGTATIGEDFTVVTGSSITNSATTPGVVNVLFKAGETSKTIQLSLIDDKIAESLTGTDEIVRAAIVDAKEFRVTNHADPGFTDLIAILDINSAGVKVLKNGSPASTSMSTVAEDSAGSSIEYSLKLNSKPTANVVVSVGSSDVSEGLISKSSDGARVDVVHLLFTPANWNIEQTVYLKGVEDRVDDGDVPFSVVVTVQGEDDVYRKVSKQNFSAINADNDELGIAVSNPLTTVDGRQNVFSVTLKSQPNSDVRVTMNVPDEQLEIEDARAGDPYTLVFTPKNWDLPQLVRVTAVDDGIVENFHRSQVVFRVEVGRAFVGSGIADNFTAERALDLGEVAGGVRWTNMSLRENENRVLQDEWFRIKLTSGGSSLDKLRLKAPGDHPSKLPTIFLYSADGTRELRHSGSDDAATRELSLQGLTPKEYLIKIGRGNSSQPFDFFIDDADRAYESVDLAPLPVSIKDNDLPTAEIIAGPTASEVSGKPSYFAVRLNAPTAAEASDVGIKVNFKITGGRATVGNNTSALHDYTVLADHFTINPNNPSTGTGWIRVAPGDLQANIGIVPVDDKAVEDMALTVRRITPITGGYDLLLSTIQSSYRSSNSSGSYAD